jgi:hypothetical protein
MANNVRVTELDFDTIKDNLKTYLRNQSQFTDYDFDASNLNVLLDILAYNTHYNAVLANMVSNEMFLDTALKRSSVVSLAKQINYTPQSRRSATANLTVAVSNVPSAPNFLTLEPYTQFTTIIDGTGFTFYNINSYSATPVNRTYTFTDVSVYQGRIVEQYFTVGANSSPVDRYEISNANTDTQTLQVLVQYNGVGQFDAVYTPVTDITEVNSASTVYYLQENTRGLYEIYFGDDVLGRKLNQGDIVKVRYLISDGGTANVSTNVPLSWSVNAIAGETANDRIITTVSKPAGGSERETIDSIRFRSLNNYTAQGRAVTKTDYATLISNYLPGVQSVNIWGGENNDPPQYGKTFISVKPKTGYVLTAAEKEFIVDEILKPRSVVTAQHEFVDPTLTYFNFNIDVRYSSAQTARTAAQIQTLVNDVVTEFMNTNLAKFNATFYSSQLEEQLMDIDNAILNVSVGYELVRRLPLVPNVRFTGAQNLQYPSKLHPAEIRSSHFYFNTDGVIVPTQIRDVPDESPPDYEGAGTLKTFNLNTGAVINNNLGTVNYATGKVTINSNSALTLAGYIGNINQLYIYAGVQRAKVGAVFPGYNEFFLLDDAVAETISNVANGITINVVAVNS